ncbi:MAG: hypothetical protein RI883_979 [Bacteroidota bacterium]|jgi:hypothetical protein
MKKSLFILTLLLSLFSSAQRGKGFFLEANFGMRFNGITSDVSKLKPGFHMDGAVGYMINNFVGLKVDGGYDSFRGVKTLSDGTEIKDRSYMLRGSVQGVLSISELAKMNVKYFSLLFHTGFGFATNINPSYKKSFTENGGTFTDPVFKGNDDMVNIIFGFTPQYKINNNFLINLDLSTVLLPKQSHYLDRAFDSKDFSKMGAIYNVSVGVTYKFTKTKTNRFK